MRASGYWWIVDGERVSLSERVVSGEILQKAFGASPRPHMIFIDGGFSISFLLVFCFRRFAIKPSFVIPALELRKPELAIAASNR